MKQRKKRVNHKSVYQTALLIMTVILALGGWSMFSRKTDTKDRYIVAQYSSLVNRDEYLGIITRSENLMNSTGKGIIEYYYPQGKHLSSGTLVCSLRDEYYGELLKSKAEEIHRQLINSADSVTTENVKNVNLRISSQVSNWLRSGNMLSIYELKDSVNAMILERDSSFLISRNAEIHALLEEQGIYRSEMDQSSIQYFTPSSGMVLYTYDGYEGWGCDQLGTDFIDNYANAYQTIALDLTEVDNQKPIYRLVMKDEWNLTIFMTEEESKEYTVGQMYSLTAEGKEFNAKVAKKVLMQNGEYKVVFEVAEMLYEFSDKRIVGVSRSSRSIKGIQVPSAAIYTGDFFYIPSDALTSSGSQQGVMVVPEDGENHFVPVSVFAQVELEDGTKVSCFQGNDTLKAGTVIVKPEKIETFTINGKTSLDYCLIDQNGKDVMRPVTILEKEGSYCIISGVEPLTRIRIQ